MTIFDHLKVAPACGTLARVINRHFALPNLKREDLGGLG